MWFTQLLIPLLSLYVPGLHAGYTIPQEQLEKEPHYWKGQADIDIQEALKRPRITGVAKNIILFLGDGMGITMSTAGRIFKGQKNGKSGEEGYLEWERFPNVGLLKTYNLDTQVPDSASTATAYLTGVKANHYTVGLNGHARRDNCSESLIEKNRVTSILQWAQESGKDTGFVTTTRVTHATPSALYAHSASRVWECDKKLLDKGGEQALKCKDIASQLVEEEPGKNINVILGGGILQLGGELNHAESDDSCTREDGKDLTTTWQEQKKAEGKSYAYVDNVDDLKDIDVEKTDSILGLFAPGHLPYSIDMEDEKEKHSHVPTLAEMTQVAIKRLRLNENGFFLLVEGGRIDHGLHDGKTHRACEELVAFEKAVKAGLEMVDMEDTLFLVTADHSHTMTINGYPARGNDILGKSTFEHVIDGMPHTTLMFTNGPGGSNYSYNGKEVMRSNLTGVDTRDKDFIAQAAVNTVMGEETHGGEDVAIYAHGPMAHLFHRLHEQAYVAHVMGYASCVGPYSECDRPIEDPGNIYCIPKESSGSNMCINIGSIILGSILILITR